MNAPLISEEKAAHTPGPWGWFGGKHGFYLATQRQGRTYVMCFGRMGMNGAQPRFRVGGYMTDAKDLAQFEVGKRDVVGFEAAKQEGSGVYRMDVRGFDHPDARLIATAPELLEALRELLASELTQMPSYEAGKEAQDAWADRQAAARNNARFIIDKAAGAA